MVRTHQLLAEKYSLSADNVGTGVSTATCSSTPRPGALRARRSTPGRSDPDASDPRPPAGRLPDRAGGAAGDRPRAQAPSVAVENIYQKRHIAAGIPSMYGTYSEPKFDALGLSFRVENWSRAARRPRPSEGTDSYVTRDSLRRMAATMRRFERALAADGVDSRNLSRQPAPARVQLQQPQLHLPPVPERVPVHRRVGHRALADLHPQPRPGAAHRAQARSPAVRGPLHVGWTPSPRWCCARCWSRPWACRPSTATCPPRCADLHAGRTG